MRCAVELENMKVIFSGLTRINVPSKISKALLIAKFVLIAWLGLNSQGISILELTYYEFLSSIF